MSTKRSYHVRVGLLRAEGSGGTRYGARASVPVASFVQGKVNLQDYSLIIPAFTERSDILSRKDEQRAQPWLWNTYEHPRYFGLLDLDMDLDEVQRGPAPLFSDMPACVYKDAGEVKRAFADRLMDGSTFGQILELCPPFARLYQAVRALLGAMTVVHVAYFSGGGGFRVLFHSPSAWRTVTWGHTYALTFHAQELRPLLLTVAPTVPAQVLDMIMAATDKNIYDSDKGTKPDLLAHFDTRIWPHQVHNDESFVHARPSRTSADAGLSRNIRAFWQRIFQSLPMDPAPLPLVAQVAEPAIVNYPHVLYKFPKCGKDEGATHLVLQGKTTSYRRVDDIDRFYRMLIEQKRLGQPINAHEIRTNITRHTIDYDGGPPLMVKMARADMPDTEQTVLHAIQ